MQGIENRAIRTMLVIIVVGLMLGLSAPVRADNPADTETVTHLKASGTVTHIKSGVVFVKTSWGQVSFASGDAPKNIKAGEEVEMTMSENNVVIDVHRKGEPAHHHRHITGKLKYAAPDRKEITLWIPEGEKTFVVQKGRSQLSGLKEGQSISVELNEAGNVIDIHKARIDVTINPNPRTETGHHIKLSGKVTKIKAGLVQVHTPGASYSLSVKTAPPDINVGDELSLWVNENNVVVDHHRKGDKDHHHRFITGKLVYTSPDRSEIKLWTPEGEKAYDVQTGKSKLSTVNEGTAITVEVNEAGKVIDLRKAG